LRNIIDSKPFQGLKSYRSRVNPTCQLWPFLALSGAY